VTDRYPHVFNPIRLGPVEIENRFYFSPHGTLLNAGGGPSDDFAHYYAERAAGGCGLLIHGVTVLPNEMSRRGAYEESSVASFAAVADRVHDEGAKLFAELHYHNNGFAQWGPLTPIKPFLSPTPYQRHGEFRVGHEMTHREIEGFVEAHRRNARNLAAAGYDGLEVHATHGVLIETFLSPYWNRREDEYGGDLNGRMRLLCEVLEAVRDGAGDDVAVGTRLVCDERLPRGLDHDGMRAVLAELVRRGLVDFVDLDESTHIEDPPLGMPGYFSDRLVYEPYVAAVREAAGDVPVLSSLGRVTTVAEAERALASGVVDMVGATRGLIAEPALVNNAREGREDRSRTCVAANWCLQSLGRGMSGCMVNPAATRERLWGARTMRPSERTAKVVVAGAGPGGLEAALIAAQRGHDVVVFEREDALGGQLRLWAAIPGREIFAITAQWYERRLQELGVDVRTGTAATAELVLAEAPDAVIVATGSQYAADGEHGDTLDAIPGHDGEHVHTPESILEGRVALSGRVVVVDGEGLNTGAGVAELLAESGARVDVVTEGRLVARHTYLDYEAEVINRRLRDRGVSIRTRVRVERIGAAEVVLLGLDLGQEVRLTNVAAVVLATMRRSESALLGELDGRVQQLFGVGDALGPRGVAEATFEGQKFARMIGEPGAPQTFAEAYYEPVAPEAWPSPASAMRDRASAPA
jgi:2,4-dienoyl-CoA reductase-like NADH-dependent reductase (Old Yellow Enzyme family)/thioredoxin reductase